MLVIAGIAAWRKWSAAAQWKWATASMLLIAAFFLIPEGISLARLRHQFPYESAETRLARSGEGEAKATAIVRELESKLPDHSEPRGWWNRSREATLKDLHERVVETFLSQPGFGVMRGPGPRVSEERLKDGLRSDEPLPQNSKVLLASSLGEIEVGSAPNLFDDVHLESVRDFVHPEGWGFFKDRQHVAGFQSHRLSKAPQTSALRLERLDLIGLVVHNRPIAYVTEELPQMDRLRQAPIRELDAFETAGLEAIRKGDDLFARKQGDHTRVLGAIRAADACTKCHECERGALLGAFSYLLASK